MLRNVRNNILYVCVLWKGGGGQRNYSDMGGHIFIIKPTRCTRFSNLFYFGI